MNRNALLSVFDKTGLEDFARGLVNLDFTLYGSKGTCEYLSEYNIEAIDVGERIIGRKPTFGHRLATLSWKMFLCLLYRHANGFSEEERQQDSDELKAMDLIKFDLVYVDLYPFKKAVADPSLTHQQKIEKIDIGGRALLTAAAKNGLITLCDKKDWKLVTNWLRDGMPQKEGFLRKRAGKVEAYMADYSLSIAKYLLGDSRVCGSGKVCGDIVCDL